MSWSFVRHTDRLLESPITMTQFNILLLCTLLFTLVNSIVSTIPTLVSEILQDNLNDFINLGGPEQCSVNACNTTYTNSEIPKVTQCNVASGALPLATQASAPLPYYFTGNYDMCMTFPLAHYCTVRLYTQGFLFATLDQCVSKKCTKEDFRE